MSLFVESNKNCGFSFKLLSRWVEIRQKYKIFIYLFIKY